MDVYWVDTADDLKREVWKEGHANKSMCWNFLFIIVGSCEGVVYEPQDTECSCLQLCYTLKFSSAVITLLCSWHRGKQGSCSWSCQ